MVRHITYVMCQGGQGLGTLHGSRSREPHWPKKGKKHPIASLKNTCNFFCPPTTTFCSTQQTGNMDFRPKTKEEIVQRNNQRKANEERSNLRVREFRRNTPSPVHHVHKVPLHYLSTEARNLTHVHGTTSGLVTIVSGQPTDLPTAPVRKQAPARLRERQLATINKILQLSTNS